MRVYLTVAAIAALGLSLSACAIVGAGGAVIGAGAHVVGAAASVAGDIVTAPFGGGESDDHKK